MPLVKILGVDASLRCTGLSKVTYNTELPFENPGSFKVTNCQVLINPQKYRGTDAILNMIDMMSVESKKECYIDCDTILVESPPIMFNAKWSSSTVAMLGHISGAAVAVFGLEKSYLFKPSEWNKTKNKEKTHSNIIQKLGDPNLWHYEKDITHEKYYEHVLDATAFAWWWLKNNYAEDS